MDGYLVTFQTRKCRLFILFYFIFILFLFYYFLFYFFALKDLNGDWITGSNTLHCQWPNYVPVYGACLEGKLLNFGSSIGVGKGPETGLPVGRV